MGQAPESSDLPNASKQHGDAARLDVFAELERSGVPQKEENAQEKSAAAPSTALVFQPPDHASARKPRRASAPAGPPPSAADGDSGSKDDAPKEDAAKDSSQAGGSKAKSQKKSDSKSEESGDSGTAQDADDSGTEGGQRRRRRRGGRGRRGRGGSSNANNGNNAETSDGSDSQGDSQGAAADKSDQSENQKGRDAKGANDEKADGTGSEKKADTEKKSEKSQDSNSEDADATRDDDGESQSSGSRRRRRRRRGGSGSRSSDSRSDEVATPRGSTRLEAKRQRRREGRETGRRKPVITEAEFLARRESVNRAMMVRERDGRMQIAVLEDDVLVEHYVSRNEDASIAGNVYVGKVQNVLPSMEAAFVDIGKGRNAVLYAGEVNWDAAGLEADEPRRIETALTSGDHILVQVTKDPIGHKGARLTAQVSLAGRFLVFVPDGSMTGISRKLPDTERARLKKILKDIVPEGGGVIVRTAAEGATEEELRADIDRLQKRWRDIESAQKGVKKSAGPKLVHSEADMAIRVVRDIFNEDFEKLVVSGGEAWNQISNYIEQVAPDLSTKLSKWDADEDIFAAHRIDEQLAKAMDRKVYLPSGGSLVIDRTEAMTVVDVNTGRFTGTGGTLEETVTKNNLEAAEEVVRQLRLRDIGGIIVIDFIDMVLEQNRDLVMRRLVECLGRDRTKHQVAEVTSLGLVQMTRKRVGQGLVEAFSEKCDHCGGRGFITHDEPVEKDKSDSGPDSKQSSGRGGDGGRRNNRRRKKDTTESDSGKKSAAKTSEKSDGASEEKNEAADAAIPSETPEEVRAALAAIAAAAVQSHERNAAESETESEDSTPAPATEAQPE